MTPPTDSLDAALRAVPGLCERALRPDPGDDDDPEAEPCRNHGEQDIPALAAAVREWMTYWMPAPLAVRTDRAPWERGWNEALAEVARRLGI